MYIDTHSMSDEDKAKLKRQLTMKQLSLDSDLKKVHRKQLELKDAMRRLKIERDRIEVHIKESEKESAELIKKEDFITEELRHIKKKLIELG